MDLVELKEALIKPICDNCACDGCVCCCMYQQAQCMKLDLTITSIMLILKGIYD